MEVKYLCIVLPCRNNMYYLGEGNYFRQDDFVPKEGKLPVIKIHGDLIPEVPVGQEE